MLAENKDPQRAADELKRIVHQRGADDNLTAVVVQMGRARQTPIIAIDDDRISRSEGRRKWEEGRQEATPQDRRSRPAKSSRKGLYDTLH